MKARRLKFDPDGRRAAAPLFGYDLFLSFALGPAPRGSRAYAADLTAKLRELGFTVFFSEDEAPPGAPLSDTLKAALRRSRLLVVLANRGTVLDPRWVREEVLEFRRVHGGRRRVVPISLDGALDDAELQALASDWLLTGNPIRGDDTAEALATGVASAATVLQVAKAPTAWRAQRVLRSALAGLALFFAGLTAVAGFATWRALLAVEAEAAATSVAQKAAAEQALAASQARRAERRASEAAAKEAVAALDARRAASAAELARADEQAARERAEASAREAQSQRIAEASAGESSRERHDRALLGAVAAYDHHANRRTESAMLAALLERPHLQRYTSAGAAAFALAFARQGQWLAWLDRMQQLHWLEVATGQPLAAGVRQADGAAPSRAAARAPAPLPANPDDGLPALVPSTDGAWLALRKGGVWKVFGTHGQAPLEMPWACEAPPGARAAFSADGRTLALECWDDTAPGARAAAEGATSHGASAAAAPMPSAGSRAHAATARKRHLRLVTPADGRARQAALPVDGALRAIGFAREGGGLVVLRAQGRFEWWPLDSTGVRLRLHEVGREPLHVAHAPLADRWMLAFADGSLQIWDLDLGQGTPALDSGPAPATPSPGGDLRSLVIAPQGERVLLGYADGRVLGAALEAAGGRVAGTAARLMWRQGSDGVQLALHQDGLVAATALFDPLALLDLRQPHPLQVVPPYGPLRHAAVGAEGKVQAWIDDSRQLHLADAAGHVKQTLKVPDFAWPPQRIDISASGRRLAVVRRFPPTAAVWDLSASARPPLRLPGGRLHPLGQHWLVESDRSSLTSHLVPLAEPARRLAEFSTAPHGVSGSAFNADGSMLVLAQEDGALRAWSLDGLLEPGRLRSIELGHLQPFEGPVAAPLFDTRGRLVTPHLRGAAQWTLPARPEQRPVWHWLVPSGTGIAPQRAGALDETLGLLAQARGGTLQLWQLDGNEALAPALQLRSARTQQLAFDRMRRWLLVSSEDEPAEALTLEPRDWRARACAVAGRNLTCAEWQRFQPTKPYRLLCAAHPPPEPACAAPATRRAD